MRWFNGNMLQAIAEAHNRRVLLLVFVEGDDLASQNMRATFDDPDVDKLLEVMGCVPVRLRANSSACRQFTLVYPVTAIPSTFFISSRGNLESSVVGCVDPLTFGDRLASLMASANLRKVDSDMRNMADLPGVSVDRVLGVNRQPSAAKVAANPGDPHSSADLKKKGQDRRKRKKQQNVANVQTSIPALAEQATQIDWDDVRSYGNLLQKLATVEESSQASAAPPQAAADTRTKITSASIFGGRPRDVPSPDVPSGPSTVFQSAVVSRVLSGTSSVKSPAGTSLGARTAATTVGKAKSNCSDNVAINTSAMAFGSVETRSLCKKSVPLEGNVPQRQSPFLTLCPPSASSKVPTAAGKCRPPSSFPEVQPLTYEEMECVLEDVLDGPSMLFKFAVLAQEFAEKVLSNSLFEDPPASEAFADVARSPGDTRKSAGFTAKKKKKAPSAKTEAPSSKSAKRGKRRSEEAAKRSCQLESLATNVGDSPDVMKALRDEATSPSEQGSRGARPSKQRKSEATSKAGTEKSKRVREPRENAGDNTQVVAKKPAAPESRQITLDDVARKIKEWEALQPNARASEKKAKKTTAQPAKVQTEAAEVASSAEPKVIKESDPFPRPVIDTILEEEACLDEPPVVVPTPTETVPIKPVTAAQNTVTKHREKQPKCPSPARSKEFLTASNSQMDEFVAIPRKCLTPSEPHKLTSLAPAPPVQQGPAKRDSDGDDETIDGEDSIRSPPLGDPDPEWFEQVIRAESRRALLGRADESMQNISRAMNELESRTLSLSNLDKDGGSQSDVPKTAPKTGASGTKQHVRVTINESRDVGLAPIATLSISPRPDQRISVSGTNVRSMLRNRTSAIRLPERPASERSSLRRCASFTPVDQDQDDQDDYNGNKRSPTNIVLNLPDGSSVLHVFPADAYLDEVRWHTEELLAQTLPSCFPFTMARTNPLREFAREDYRKTLEQLMLAPSATLLVLPRSTAQGGSGPGALRPASSDPNWVSLLRLVFGVFVASPLSLVWGILNGRRNPTVEEIQAFTESRHSSLAVLPPPPSRSRSSGGAARKRFSSHADDFDLF